MDEQYLVEYVKMNKHGLWDTVSIYFDSLTTALSEVNRLANDIYFYKHIYLKWGDSLLLELYDD